MEPIIKSYYRSYIHMSCLWFSTIMTQVHGASHKCLVKSRAGLTAQPPWLGDFRHSSSSLNLSNCTDLLKWSLLKDNGLWIGCCLKNRQFFGIAVNVIDFDVLSTNITEVGQVCVGNSLPWCSCLFFLAANAKVDLKLIGPGGRLMVT